MAAGDLTSVEKVKTLLTITDAGSDAALTILVTEASDYLASELNRQIVSGAVVETRDGHGGRSITTRKWPVSAVTSVVIDGVTIPAGGFRIAGQRLIALEGYAFTKGIGNVVLSYTAGYATIPERYVRACESTVMRWFRELDRIGQISKVIGGENVTYALGLPDDVKRLIAREQDVVPV